MPPGWSIGHNIRRMEKRREITNRENFTNLKMDCFIYLILYYIGG
jgi:hypothetical protein